jgi:hypothetical protein
MLESPLHEHHLLRYTVEIEDTPMHKSKQTAIVDFFDENNKRVTSHRFAVISKEEIYEWISNGENINLTDAYVKDFSLTEYRTQKGLDDHVYLKLLDFRARRAFFDCEICTDFSYAQFDGERTVFESTVFGNGFTNFFSADFGHGDVNFRKAKFGSGSTSFKSVKFGDGDITFNNANFGTGDLSFADSNFSNGNVDYKNTYFGDGNIDFKFAKFASGDITFERASFGKGKKDFKNVEFGGGRIDFRRIEFNDGDVSFEGVEFGDGKVSFRGSNFGKGHKTFESADFHAGEAHFDLVHFGMGTLSFNACRVMDISFKGCHLDCYIDLRFGECHLADLRGTIVRDILDAVPENEKVVITQMNLAGMRILGRLFINWHENKVYDLIYNQTNTSYFQKAEQFRILKENFRNNGQYEDEDAAYLEFRRCEAKSKLHDRDSKTKDVFIIKWLRYYFHKYVFDFIGRYATAPTRVLSNALLAVFVFAMLYYIITVFFPGLGYIATTLPLDIRHTHDFWNAVYFSAITFCTVGYGDYFAMGALKFLAAFEGFSGIFLMSYFTVAFVRKILR